MKQTFAEYFSENEPQMSMRNQSPFLFTSVFGLFTALSLSALAQGSAPAVAPASSAEPAPRMGVDPGVLPTTSLEPLAFEAELSSFVQPGALTSQQVAERALTGSPRVEAKEAAVTSAQTQADAVLGEFYPKLTGTARYTRLSAVAVPVGFEAFIPPFDQFALQATLTIPVSDYILRLSTALSGASKNEDSARFNARAERLIVATDARIAYYTWVKATGALYVATKAKEQVAASLRDVQLAFSMGTQSKADVLRTEAQFFQTDLRLMRAQQAVQVMTENLRTVMHETAAKEYLVGEPILDDIQVANVPSVEAGYEEARSKRLELRALTSLEEATRNQASLAKVAYYPRIDLQGNALYSNPNTRVFPYNDGQWHGTWDASVLLSWTPTDIPKAMGDAGTATAKVAELSAQRRALEEGLRVEVATAISELNNSLAAVKTSREALKSAEEGFRVRTELFKAGRATTLEVTDAQNSLTGVRLELVFAHADARIARDKLAHALGRDVPAESEGK